ncbi:MAG: T9SS type A sorting domain-containing protein [Flavobacteriales bacterium]|nr:T9SS type A sorting domain-containing protein [Flavobacteriales bacterium]
MILRYTLPAFLFIAATAHGQQLLTLTDYDGNAVNGTLVVHVGSAESSVEEVGIHAVLEQGGQREVNVRRYEVDVQATTQNYFCWGICYGPQDAGFLPVWNSLPQHSLQMQEDVEVNNFKAYHVPMGLEGSSTYRYVFYDVAVPTDSVWVDIEFQSLPVGIEEVASSASLVVFPNPSKGADVQFELDAPGLSGASILVIHNAVGQRIRTSTIRAGQPVARLSTEGMAPGMYFASLEHQGRNLVTQRFVVSAR